MYETKPCPNPRCVDGLDYGYRSATEPATSPAVIRCCHTCDGRGELSVATHINRRHFQRIVSVTESLDRDARHRANEAHRPASR
ncbi:MAG TPA: hypothetical protein VGK19_21255 [Capsulimonadaceae bacterium]